VIVCGIKATHDGAVAVIEDGRLRFSVETEKLDNGERYGSLEDLQRVADILATEGMSFADVDQFVVDGWYTTGASRTHAVMWDGGIVRRLYQVRAATREVTLVTVLLPITGNSFGDFCGQFGPFSTDLTGLSPDQLMPGMSDADIATFQDYLGRKLLERLAVVVQRRFPGQRMNLVLGGGCALNIEWNSAIRASGLFRNILCAAVPERCRTGHRHGGLRVVPPRKPRAGMGRSQRTGTGPRRGAPGLVGPVLRRSATGAAAAHRRRARGRPVRPGRTGPAGAGQSEHPGARHRPWDEGTAQRDQEPGRLPAGGSDLPRDQRGSARRRACTTAASTSRWQRRAAPSPAASGNGSRSPGRSQQTPRFSCWTIPPPRWTR
jgi:hypothetical protein